MEQYYRIPIQPLPEIRFSMMATSRNYHWENEGGESFLEINYAITGSPVFQQGSRQETFPQGTVFAVSRSERFEMTCPTPLYQEYTFGLILSAPAVLVEEEEIASMRYASTEAIIPRTVSDPAMCRQIYNLLTAIGSHRRDVPDPVRRLMVYSRLYELLALLTRYSLQLARRRHFMSSRRQNSHCHRACMFVQENLSQKIRMSDVAKYTGVGYRQLSALFHKHMGVTLVDYINQEKIQRVKQLILTEGVTLEAAGEAVGISNTKYLSTLFHKYTGMTVRQCRQMRR